MKSLTLNEILGVASINEQFAQELLHDPVATVQKYGYSITRLEQKALEQCHAQTLSVFSQQLLSYLEIHVKTDTGHASFW